MMKKLCLLAVLISANIYAADWRKIGDNKGSNLYIDMENSSFPNLVWAKIEYNYNERVGNILYNKSVGKYEISCNKRKMRILSSNYYNDSDMVRSFGADRTFSDVVPESYGEIILKTSCALGKHATSENDNYHGEDENAITDSVSTIIQKTDKQCNQAYKDLAYYTQISWVCNKKTINYEELIPRIMGGCAEDLDKFNNAVEIVANSIINKLNGQETSDFCKDEGAYFKFVKKKYGL